MGKGTNAGLRGAVFEVLVKDLALRSGYRPIAEGAKELQLFTLGTLPMVHGLGEGHNADVLLSYPFRMALTPEMRLLIECKVYQARVGLDTIRTPSALGLI